MLDIEFLHALRRGMLPFLANFALLCGALLFSALSSFADNPPTNGTSFKGEDFFHNHGAVMLLIDPDSGAVLDANQAAVRFYGHAHEVLITLNIQDINLLSPEEVAAEMALAREQRRNHFVFRHRLADDQVRDVEVTSWPVAYRGQQALFSIVHDITQRIQAEKALRAQQANLESLVADKTRELRRAHRFANWTLLLALAVLTVVTVFLIRGLRRSDESSNALRTSEQRLASVLETQQEMICRFQPDTTLTFVNEAYCRLFGKTSEDLVGRPFLDLVPESEHEAILAAISTLSPENLSHHYTHQVVSKDGRPAWQEWTDRVILDSQGRMVEIQSVGRDITERKLAEQALRDKSEELDRYFNSSLDLLCIANVRGEFVRLNPEWERVLGYTVGELEGRRFMDFVHPDDVEATLEALGRLRNQEQVHSFENRYLDRQGGYRWIEWRSIPQDDLIYAAARDITKRYAMEQALRQRGEELARSNEDLEQFAYAVSHDMRQPLRMVGSYLQILEKDLADVLTDETREYLHFAVDGARRMDGMILGLLDYSRVGRKSDPNAWMASRESLDEALSFLQPAIQESGADIRVSGDWPRIFASRDEMTRLFQNLVGNAVKYRVPERPPVVDVTVRDQGRDWLFSVRDNGVGVAPGQQDRLFKVFSRLHARGKYEGTGIGLALCRKIVEHHQGRIWVESEGEGQGSVFLFTMAKVEGEEDDSRNTDGQGLDHDQNS